MNTYTTEEVLIHIIDTENACGSLNPTACNVCPLESLYHDFCPYFDGDGSERMKKSVIKTKQLAKEKLDELAKLEWLEKLK